MNVDGDRAEVWVDRDREIPMRDGTITRADVYRCASDHPVPVLVCRTPYDKTHPRYQRVAHALARAGYLAVVQDIRGLHASEGSWTWHMTDEGQQVESRDGYDTCEWIAGLDGCDGQVGTWGNSYPSWCAWRMAIAQPPSLKALFTSGLAVRTLDTTYGIFETGIRLGFMNFMTANVRRRNGDLRYPQTVEEAHQQWALERGKWLWHVPLTDLPAHFLGAAAEAHHRYLREVAVEFWALDREHHLVTVPTCTLTGWWDRLSGAADHYPGMVDNGPPELRDQHRLVIGPWVHDLVSYPDWTGPRDYGLGTRDGYVSQVVRWYDWQLKGIDNGWSNEKPVSLFILNDNDWRQVDSWPPAEARQTALYLHSAGDAQQPHSEGRLSLTVPLAEPPDSYTYDPRDPVMTLHEGQLEACDQRPLSQRRDILTYQTRPLERDLLVTGRVSCVLWVTSDCPDTDFVARLIEVGRDGVAVNISHGIMRARYRQGYDREVPLTPGQPTELRITMLACGIRFARGSRIRLDVTSSDFPAFDRNHNTGLPYYDDATFRVARQQILHDREHPSRLLIPVIPTDPVHEGGPL